MGDGHGKGDFAVFLVPPGQQARALRAPTGRRFRPPFTKPRAWGERGGQGGFTLGTPGMGSEGGLQRPRQPWLRHLGAREELAGSTERESYGLGKVEESAGVLTFEGIGSRWPGGGDRREDSALGEGTEEGGIGVWKTMSAGAGRLGELRTTMESGLRWLL